MPPFKFNASNKPFKCNASPKGPYTLILTEFRCHSRFPEVMADMLPCLAVGLEVRRTHEGEEERGRVSIMRYAASMKERGREGEREGQYHTIQHHTHSTTPGVSPPPSLLLSLLSLLSSPEGTRQARRTVLIGCLEVVYKC